MPSKHISSIDGDTEQHVSYHFDTIQEMIEFERFLQENTFEKYHKDQEIAREAVSNFISKLKFPISYELRDDITPADIDAPFTSGPRPWIVDWKKVEEEIGPEYKWFAADEDGLMGLYTGRPKIEDYDEGKGYFYPGLDDRSYTIGSEYILQEGTVPWNESLVQKPE
jgi:hypothetical protein